MMHPCPEKAFPEIRWMTYPPAREVFFTWRWEFLSVCLIGKPDNSAISTMACRLRIFRRKLSVRLGSALEHNAKKNRVRTFRNRTGDASASSWAGLPCDEGGKL